MEELTTSIIVTGSAAAVFVWLLTRFVKPKIEERGNSEFVINMVALFFGMLVALGLSFILEGLNTWQNVVQALFVGLAAAGVATFGHEAVKNFRQRGDTITVGNVTDSSGVAIGEKSDASVE